MQNWWCWSVGRSFTMGWIHGGELELCQMSSALSVQVGWLCICIIIFLFMFVSEAALTDMLSSNTVKWHICVIYEWKYSSKAPVHQRPVHLLVTWQHASQIVFRLRINNQVDKLIPIHLKICLVLFSVFCLNNIFFFKIKFKIKLYYIKICLITAAFDPFGSHNIQ